MEGGSLIFVSCNKNDTPTPLPPEPEETLALKLKSSSITDIEYIYDPVTRMCFSYYTDEGDDEVLDIYGIRDWVELLPEKRISIASLANSYTIIGL